MTQFEIDPNVPEPTEVETKETEGDNTEVLPDLPEESEGDETDDEPF